MRLVGHYTQNHLAKLIIVYAIYSLISKWLISWGGAKFIEGRLWAWLFGFRRDFSAEEISLWAYFCWIGISIIFVFSLFANLIYG